MPKRKNVTWRIGDSSQNKLINDWLDQQKNIQDSITNIVLHMIDRFGMQNITDHEIQKILYQESLAQPEENHTAEKNAAAKQAEDNPKQPSKKASSQPHQDESRQDTDDMYSQVDIDNL